MFQTKVVEKIKTHVMFNNLSENRAVCDILWKNILQPGRPQKTTYFEACVSHAG
jgi:hypothetical protein